MLPRPSLKALVLVIIGLLLITLGIRRSLIHALPKGAVDFRNRVVAARQAELGLNPYLFKWTAEYPETLLDPSDEPDAKYTRMTSPPTTLWVQSWFSSLSFQAQKTANFWLSWICLLAMPLWIAYRLRGGYARAALMAGVFSTSGVWLFHLERGQQYAYFALFLVGAVFPPKFRWAERVFPAMAVYFRPTLGPVIFTFLRAKTPWRILFGSALLGFLFLVPVLVKYPLGWWLDYFASAKDWYLHRYGMHDRIVPHPHALLPGAPEGDASLWEVGGFGVPGNLIYHYFGRAGAVLIPYVYGLLATSGVTLLGGFVLWRARKELLSRFALRFFATLYLVDMALPSPRSGYNDVLFFPGILLAVLSENWIVRTSAIIASLFSLWALKNPFSSPYSVQILYILTAVLALAMPTQRSVTDPSSASLDPGLPS